MKIGNPCNGKIKRLEEVNDEAFSQKMMGDGFAVMPQGNVVCSPVKGTVNMIFPTKHALGLTSEDGIEVLVHIGLDTVELNGEFFSVQVKEYQSVDVGTPLVTCDFDQIEKNFEKDVVVIITNTSSYDKIMLVKEGSSSLGETVLEIE